MGITNAGRSAELKFREITGAVGAPRARDGDALLFGELVEIKKATTKSVNQIRAVKYLPVVVYYEPESVWYVIPAHFVVGLVSDKRRGQHTENPFECATLSLEKVERFRTQEENLRTAVLNAMITAAEYPEIKALMNDVLVAARAAAVESIQLVRAKLHELELIE